jgi:ribulose-bisphosphate carboxylase small chain
MQITQGTFSFLPDLTDEQIARQIGWALSQGWALSVEWTDDPHPRNVYWEMHGPPSFDVRDPADVLREVRACRAAHAGSYVKVNAFDARPGWETVRLSFIVQRPPQEARFRLVRRDGPGRIVTYGLERDPAPASAGGHP